MGMKIITTFRKGNPEAAKMMDLMEDQNEGLTPDNVTMGSQYEAFFQCLKNPKHIFKKRICKMTSDRDGHNIGCIYCGPNAKIAFPGETDLFTIIPEAKEMWAYDLNAELDPLHLLPGSAERAYFRCQFGHLENKKICDFAKSPICQTCARYFIYSSPKIRLFSDNERNLRDEIDIEHLKRGEHTQIHLKCPACDYRWTWYPNLWLKREYCPHCGYDGTDGSQEKNRELVNKLYNITTLAEGNPVAYALWDKTKNGDLVPEEIPAKSNINYWFTDKNGYSIYESPDRISRRAEKYSSVEEAISSMVFVKRNHKRLFDNNPEAKKYYNEELNNGKAPEEIPLYSGKPTWFNCPEGMHEPFTLIPSKLHGMPECPCCAPVKKTLAKKKNSPSNPVSENATMMRFWDPKNSMDPKMVSVYSTDDALWRCPNCNYEWVQTVYNRFTAKAGKCPCCELKRRFDEENKPSGLKTLRDHNPSVAQYFNLELSSGYTPDNLLYGSGKIIYLNCCNNRHEPYPIRVADIPPKPPYRCPGCLKEAEDKNRLIIRVPNVRNHWCIEKNTIKLEDAKIWMSESVWFTCDNGHLFQKEIRNYAKNQECPFCKMDVAANYPTIVKYWNFVENNKIGLDINTISANSKKSAFWKCKKCGYEWKSEIFTRKISLGKCPCCEGRSVVAPGINDIFTLIPEVKLDIIPDENKGIDFTTIGPAVVVDFNWTCHKCGYKWQTHHMAQRFVLQADGSYKLSECPHCMGKYSALTNTERWPSIVKYYNEELNGKPFDALSYDELLSGNIWWDCFICKESYQSNIKTKLQGENSSVKGCIYCAGKAVRKGESFAELHPECMDEYSPENDIDPYNVTEHSRKGAKWICRNNSTHSWLATFNERALGYKNCPICVNKNYKTKLAETHPEFKTYYDTDRNIRAFESYSAYSNEYVWWNCDSGHSFEWPVMNFVRLGHFDCPVCRAIMVLPGVNRIRDKKPEILADWSSNNIKSPDEYAYNSKYPALWVCHECGGEYPYRIIDREINDESCPYCYGKKIMVGYNSLQDTDPELVAEYSSNNERPATDFRKDSSYMARWNCPKCGGEYQAKIRDRELNDEMCPYCHGKKVLVGYNSLPDTHPDLAAEYSPNDERPATDFRKDSAYMALWNCPKCGNEYRAMIRDRELDDEMCPYCHGKKVLLGYNSLPDTHPDLAAEYSPNNERPATDFRKDSAYMVRWSCPICGGEYLARIRDRELDDERCPYCKGTKVLPGFNSFDVKHPDEMDEWDDLTNYLIITPNKITERYNKYVGWRCRKCGNFYMQSPAKKLYYRKRQMEPCPYCKGRRRKIRRYF